MINKKKIINKLLLEMLGYDGLTEENAQKIKYIKLIINNLNLTLNKKENKNEILFNNKEKLVSLKNVLATESSDYFYGNESLYCEFSFQDKFNRICTIKIDNEIKLSIGNQLYIVYNKERIFLYNEKTFSKIGATKINDFLVPNKTYMSVDLEADINFILNYLSCENYSNIKWDINSSKYNVTAIIDYILGNMPTINITKNKKNKLNKIIRSLIFKYDLEIMNINNNFMQAVIFNKKGEYEPFLKLGIRKEKEEISAYMYFTKTNEGENYNDLENILDYYFPLTNENVTYYTEAGAVIVNDELTGNIKFYDEETISSLDEHGLDYTYGLVDKIVGKHNVSLLVETLEKDYVKTRKKVIE